MPGPIFGDDLLPERPWTAIKNGSAEGIDMILGYNRDEGDTFIQASDVVQAWFPSWDCVEKMLENNGKKHLFPELKEVYKDSENEQKGLSDFVTDYLFAKDAYRCADSQINHGNVWMYRFDYVPFAYKQMNMGSVHSVEIPFALDTLDRGYFAYPLKGTPQDQLEAIRNQINSAWLNFAKTGSPNGEELEWSKYEGIHSPLHLFDLQPSNQDVRLNKKIFDIWEKLGLMYDKE